MIRDSSSWDELSFKIQCCLKSRMVLEEVKQRKKGSAMGLIDYNMIAQLLILESLKDLGVNR